MAHYNLAKLLGGGVKVADDGTPLIEKELDESVAQFTKAIKINPKYPNVYYHLALVLEDMADYQKAKMSLETAIKLNKEYAEAHYRLALLLPKLG